VDGIRENLADTSLAEPEPDFHPETTGADTAPRVHPEGFEHLRRLGRVFTYEGEVAMV